MSISRQLVDKSVHAAVAAIEVYNKPDFHFREEAFSLLLTNAWELLLKAKWAFDRGDKVESLYALDENGNPKLSKSQNPITHSISYLAAKLLEDPDSGVDKAVFTNLCGLIEIRDNAVHFLNKNLMLGQAVLEVGMAAVQNFVQLSREWFQVDLSRYNFYLMPLSFYHGFEIVSSTSVSPTSVQVSRLVEYLRSLDSSELGSDAPPKHFVACRLETKLTRAKDVGAVSFRYTDDPAAPAMMVREEDVLKNYPLSYRELTDQLRKRYADFVENKAYHKIRKGIEDNKKYSIVRLLNPRSPNSAKMRCYNANIITEFDKHYTKRQKG